MDLAHDMESIGTAFLSPLADLSSLQWCSPQKGIRRSSSVLCGSKSAALVLRFYVPLAGANLDPVVMMILSSMWTEDNLA